MEGKRSKPHKDDPTPRKLHMSTQSGRFPASWRSVLYHLTRVNSFSGEPYLAVLQRVEGLSPFINQRRTGVCQRPKATTRRAFWASYWVISGRKLKGNRQTAIK